MSFAKGRKAKFICERSGMSYPLKYAVREPGTGYLVYYKESDGKNSLVEHPQNKPARLAESTALRWSRPDDVAPSVAGYAPELRPGTTSLRPYDVSATS
jgi:hypothetical protein